LAADDETPSSIQPDTSGIKVTPIPNPYESVLQEATTRPLGGGRADAAAAASGPAGLPATMPSVLLPAPAPLPSPPPPGPVLLPAPAPLFTPTPMLRPRPRTLAPQGPFDPGDIHVPPIPSPFAPASDQQPTTWPHNRGATTLPSLTNPFSADR
jgi:hypothetical protein